MLPEERGEWGFACGWTQPEVATPLPSTSDEEVITEMVQVCVDTQAEAAAFVAPTDDVVVPAGIVHASLCAERELLSDQLAGNRVQYDAGPQTETNLESVLQSSRARELITEVVQGLLKSTEENEGNKPIPNRRTGHIAEEKDHVEVEVEFEANTWSAFYLFFVTLENGQGLYTRFEQCSIIVTMLTTAFVQGMLIAVVWFNMTENPFRKDVIYQILRFRTLHGHSLAQVETETGKTYMDVFCNETTAPWGWEGDQYETISRYLDGQVPGYALTILALIGWVLCCASEFRTTVEQALATLAVDSTHKLDEKKYVRFEEEALHVVSLSIPRKIMILTLISIPRFAIMVTLLYTGCRYLCNTPSLEDLVLNAMALIFVIEFDELVYAVCVTARAQKIVASVQPMTFQVYRFPGGIVLKDLFRMLLCIAVLALSFTELLLPFIDSVESARDALCGGDTAVSYQAHTPLSFIHVLQHDQNVAQCPSYSSQFNSYMQDTYKVSLSSQNLTTPDDPSAIQDDRIKLLLEFVYRNNEKDKMPTTLAEAMGDAELGRGSSAQPIMCSKFDASKGIDTCRESDGSDSETACAWPYRSYLCEGWPSSSENFIKSAACATKPTSAFSCALWEEQGATNPFTKCKPEKLSGSFTVNYGRMTDDEVRSLQSGLDIISKPFIYTGVLQKFVGWTGVAGQVVQKERRLQAESSGTDGEVQVQLQRDHGLERRLLHEPIVAKERSFTLNYEILIPFPNNGFIYSTRGIYDTLSGLASTTSDETRKSFAHEFEEEFRKLSSKFNKGCLLAIENASVPTWTALESGLLDETPNADGSAAECGTTAKCVDVPGWHLSDGSNCGSFEGNGWCSNGGPGANWDQNQLKLSDVVSYGMSVVKACCACGGGTTPAARQLTELGKEDDSTSSNVFQSPVSIAFTAGADMLAAAPPAKFAAATARASSSSGVTAGKQSMEAEQVDVDLKKLLSRLAAVEQKNAALESGLTVLEQKNAALESGHAVLKQKNDALESELAGMKAKLGGMKAA